MPSATPSAATPAASANVARRDAPVTFGLELSPWVIAVSWLIGPGMGANTLALDPAIVAALARANIERNLPEPCDDHCFHSCTADKASSDSRSAGGITTRPSLRN